MKAKLMSMSSGKAILILLPENQAEDIVITRLHSAKRSGTIFGSEDDEWNGASSFELELGEPIVSQR